MNQKLIIIVGSILASLIVGSMVLYLMLSSQKNGSNSNKTIKVLNQNKQEVEVKDFNEKAYLVSKEITVITEGDLFVTTFDPKNKRFTVLLNISNASQLEEARSQGEKDLVTKLGLSEREICELNVTEAILDNGVVNLPVYNFLPSFCPGTYHFK